MRNVMGFEIEQRSRLAPSPSRSDHVVTVPLGVTGNTPDSGSGESWFDPRRGNSKRDARIKRVALHVFLGPTSVLQAFAPKAPPGIRRQCKVCAGVFYF